MPIEFNEAGSIVRVSAVDAAEAKLVVRELKMKKKDVQLQKKEISSEIAQMRAHHRASMAAATSPVRVGGTVGKMMRGMERVNKVTARNGLENRVVPLEQQKFQLDKNITAIDDCLLKLERFILENK